MNDLYHFVDQAAGVRCRPEGPGSFLLYQPKTDELHLVSELGKGIFDLCDGRPIDDVVAGGAALLEAQAHKQAGACDAEVLSFLCELERRSLLSFR